MPICLPFLCLAFECLLPLTPSRHDTRSLEADVVSRAIGWETAEPSSMLGTPYALSTQTSGASPCQPNPPKGDPRGAREGPSAAVTSPLPPFGRLGSCRSLDGLFESVRQGLPNWDCAAEAHFKAAMIELALLGDNFSRAMGRKPRNRYNVSQPDSSTCKAFARHPQSLGGTVPSTSRRVYLMRPVVSLLTAVCFIAAAEASATGVATPQSQAAPSATKSSTIDIIRQPSLRHQKLAGNCTTTCQWIGGRQYCNTHCF
jgi:hypothetical protein